MLTGNKGEWSEPYVLLKLLADGKIHLGDPDFRKIEGLFYPIIEIIRHEKNRNVSFSFDDKLVVVKNDTESFEIPISDFIEKSKKCLRKILNHKKSKSTFSVPEIESFLSSFSITSLKAKSKLKNDITIKFKDEKSFSSPTLGFSVKSQLGAPSTLVNPSGATNFIFSLKGKRISNEQIEKINSTRLYSNKFKMLKDFGVTLEFHSVDNEVFRSNLKTIDYYFEKVLAQIVLLYFKNDRPELNTIPNFIQKVTEYNPLKYDLEINSSMYELKMRDFLSDYALGMRAAQIWKREYQATGGYIIVKEDGELLCYHFYFMKEFEDYLFYNTKLETPDMKQFKAGKIYTDNEGEKIKLTLQIRFIR